MADHHHERSRAGEHIRLLIAVLFAVPLLTDNCLNAQESRMEERARAQAEKSGKLAPFTKNKAEQIVGAAQHILLPGGTGVYPWVGSVLGGGWMAFGGGYRHNYGDSGSFTALGGWSLKNYRMVQSSLQLPEIADRKIRFSLDGRWVYADKVSFYGLGNDSKQSDKTSYLHEPVQGGGTMTISPFRRFRIGGGLDWLYFKTGGGGSETSIEDKFTPATAPGLGATLHYTVSRVFAAIDWRDSPGYTRRGGLYRADWSIYDQTAGGRYNFERFQAEAVQYLPLMRENWVLAFRGLVTATSPRSGNEVPYFLMPYLGSGEYLRGFANRRFRDRNAILLDAEYRWTPGHFVDMALFYNAGKVVSHRSDLDFSRLKDGYGIGVRFHTPNATVFRIDVAHGREGLSIIFSAGPAF